MFGALCHVQFWVPSSTNMLDYVQWRVTKTVGYDIQGGAEETGFAQPGEEKAGGGGGPDCNLQLLKGVLQARWSSTTLRGVQPKDKRQWPQAAARETLSKYKKKKKIR